MTNKDSLTNHENMVFANICKLHFVIFFLFFSMEGVEKKSPNKLSNTEILLVLTCSGGNNKLFGFV